ncbi:MAG: hypothetical protein KIS86_03735 [Devosia sp.]|nr:hypothetical protein [Devosia sp.]
MAHLLGFLFPWLTRKCGKTRAATWQAAARGAVAPPARSVFAALLRQQAFQRRDRCRWRRFLWRLFAGGRLLRPVAGNAVIALDGLGTLMRIFGHEFSFPPGTLVGAVLEKIAMRNERGKTAFDARR